MREIEFRGKRFDNGEWVYGDYHYSKAMDWCYIITECAMLGSGYEVVEPATVGQYTGLKDKNGNKIYEGDICVCKNAGIDKNPFAIIWMEAGCWGWEESEDERDLFFQYIADYSEVIGNIHDNPELMEANT
jgi:uncharacterized phage protein (TIGR01671 family)